MKAYKKGFYLLVHVVYKDSSSTSKLCVVFDMSSKSSSGVTLNDQLLVGLTVCGNWTDNEMWKKLIEPTET